MKTLDGAGGQVVFEDLVVDLRQGGDIAPGLPLLLLLVALGDVHAGALKFFLPLLIDGFGDPAEEPGFGAVGTEDGHFARDRAPFGIDAV